MKLLAISALMGAIFAGGVGLVSVDTASAHFGGGSHKKGMHLGENALVPQELREEWRSEKRAMLEDMTQEERQAYRQEHRAEKQAYREAKKAAFEEFSGLTREEVKERKQAGESMRDILSDQGITEAEAEDFLTERANDKVDYLVEKHDLDAEDEQTLRDRIANFVQAVLDKWFS